MRIAHVVASLEARHGGPSRSVRQIAAATARLGHAVDLLTSAPQPQPDECEGTLRIRTWQRGAPAAICPVPGIAAALKPEAYDLLHEHGLWLRPLHYTHRAALRDHVPLVVSPRGMMAPWAWQHHRLRKALASTFVHPGAIAAVTGWHATSVEERDEIHALGYRQPVCIAPNGVNEPTAADVSTARHYWRGMLGEHRDRPLALFYSRFHQKKRVTELIDLWGKTAPSGWTLLLVGLPGQYSVDELKDHARRVGAQNIAVFDGTTTPPPYAVASLFLLPSHNENFGLVVAEALAHGVPVVVTDTTPWRAAPEHDAGWCVPWSCFSDTLQLATSETPDRLRQRGAAGRAWVLREYSWERSARTLVDFYRSLPRS